MSVTSSPNPTNANGTPSLVWSSRLNMRGLDATGVAQRREAIRQAQSDRPRTSHIEREIMWAVIILYGVILLSFAGLHIYGRIVIGPPQQEAATATAE